MTFSKALVFIAFGVVALTSSVVAAIVIWSLSFFHDPATLLLKDLPGKTWEQQNAAFRERLLRRVPLGSDERVLLRVLQEEGFTRGWEPRDTAEQSADLWWSTGVCNMGAPVKWRVDRLGRVVALQTGYREYDCL